MTNAKPFCIGFNCALGATQMQPFLQRLSKIATTYVHAYPNSGLPNAMGGYDETPENFGANMRTFAVKGRQHDRRVLWNHACLYQRLIQGCKGN